MSSGGSNPWWIAVQLHASRANTAHQSGYEYVLPAGQSDTAAAPFFEFGMPVVIEDGPLQGLRAMVLGVDARQLLIVAVTLLHRTIAVELDPGWVDIEDPGRPMAKPRVH